MVPRTSICTSDSLTHILLNYSVDKSEKLCVCYACGQPQHAWRVQYGRWAQHRSFIDQNIMLSLVACWHE